MKTVTTIASALDLIPVRKNSSNCTIGDISGLKSSNSFSRILQRQSSSASSSSFAVDNNRQQQSYQDKVNNDSEPEDYHNKDSIQGKSSETPENTQNDMNVQDDKQSIEKEDTEKTSTDNKKTSEEDDKKTESDETKDVAEEETPVVVDDEKVESEEAAAAASNINIAVLMPVITPSVQATTEEPIAEAITTDGEAIQPVKAEAEAKSEKTAEVLTTIIPEAVKQGQEIPNELMTEVTAKPAEVITPKVQEQVNSESELNEEVPTVSVKQKDEGPEKVQASKNVQQLVKNTAAITGAEVQVVNANNNTVAEESLRQQGSIAADRILATTDTANKVDENTAEVDPATKENTAADTKAAFQKNNFSGNKDGSNSQDAGQSPSQQSVENKTTQNAQSVQGGKDSFAALVQQQNSTQGTNAISKSENVLPADRKIIEQIVEKMNITVKNGQQEVKIELKPETLGELKLKLLVQNGHVEGKFIADTQQAKNIIDGNLDILKRQLEEQGLQVQKLSVTVGGSFTNHESGSGQQNQQQGRRGTRNFLQQDIDYEEKSNYSLERMHLSSGGSVSYSA